MKIIDETTSTAPIKPSMFLHGITGNGKSWWSFEGGVPMGVVLEPKAVSVIKGINPKAVLLIPECLQDLVTVMALLGQADRLQARGIDRIVLDSYTGLTEVLPAWIRKDASGPTVLAKILEIQEYGTIDNYGLAIVEAIQLTGYPSVIIGRSVSKRVGMAERIVPDSVGKSVNKLPGRLLPTAEARFDADLGRYVIDTTPADYSQRCGLPWVPPIWTGSCLEFLRVVEAGHREGQEPAGAPGQVKAGEPVKAEPPSLPASFQAAQVSAPGSDDDAWVDLMANLAKVTVGRSDAYRKAQVDHWGQLYLRNPPKAHADLAEFLEATRRLAAMTTSPDPEQDPEGYQRAFGDVCTQIQAERRVMATTVSQATSDFVDGMADGPAATLKVQEPAPSAEAPAAPRAKAEDITELMDLARTHKINLSAFWRYAQVKGGARNNQDGSPNWLSVTEVFTATILSQLKDEAKRRAFIPWLHQTYKEK